MTDLTCFGCGCDNLPKMAMCLCFGHACKKNFKNDDLLLSWGNHDIFRVFPKYQHFDASEIL